MEYLLYAGLVLTVLIGSIGAMVATTKDTAGGYGTVGDGLLALVVLGFAILTIGTSVF
ncbi:hypothetical protein [Halopiger xanaduensis]|uniref:Uncharacterized protein n=1 Tax=Halopiger xanaduensis (strain DSM 18323 / JCM 14033 / SH-6) TaxID=797210 RepID=F8DBR5_HALXS|nr:hypothetical protein [Halopiger xanaduensis]AEH38337.1 hypothetical protein Halxa_3730 [Halopiger xanaduensis SH-6]